MPSISNVTVATACQGGITLVTEAKGQVEGNNVGDNITIESTSWQTNPTPADGRNYYVLEIGVGRSWKCDCINFENNIATFSITKITPC